MRNLLFVLVVFPVNCSLTIIKGEQKNKDDYYGK